MLHAWDAVFSASEDFQSLVLSALCQSMDSNFGPSNTDIQILFLDICAITPEKCTALLAKSIVTDNKEMFDYLLERSVPLTGRFEGGKTLLHLCAQNPNNTTTIRYFGQQLLETNNVDINARDSEGRTPFMHALLARKWDLA